MRPVRPVSGLGPDSLLAGAISDGEAPKCCKPVPTSAAVIRWAMPTRLWTM